MTDPVKAGELPEWLDPRVQIVYDLLNSQEIEESRPKGKHWDGWVSMHIVAALDPHASPSVSPVAVAIVRHLETAFVDGKRAMAFLSDESLPDGTNLGVITDTAQSDDHDFKNFHRLLCERFNYGHDEKDWRRDQLSLIEHIAAVAAQQSVSPVIDPTPIAWKVGEHFSTDEKYAMSAAKMMADQPGYVIPLGVIVDAPTSAGDAK